MRGNGLKAIRGKRISYTIRLRTTSKCKPHFFVEHFLPLRFDPLFLFSTWVHLDGKWPQHGPLIQQAACRVA